jgi:hypothetical protein
MVEAAKLEVATTGVQRSAKARRAPHPPANWIAGPNKKRRENRGFESPCRQEFQCLLMQIPGYLVSVSVAVPVMVSVAVTAGDGAWVEQVGKVVGVDRVTQDNRPLCMEDFLHGEHVG